MYGLHPDRLHCASRRLRSPASDPLVAQRRAYAPRRNSKKVFSHLVKTIRAGNRDCEYFDLKGLKDDRVDKLPYPIKVLLESAVRNCDNFKVKERDVENILNWQITSRRDVEIQFKPARVILQDFTGVPAIVDLAAMRDATNTLNGDPQKINPIVPVDLVIDHSVQVDEFGSRDAVVKNEEYEINRNRERFEFLKWGANAFKNLTIVPPGMGIVHQINLEYLARIVFHKDRLLYPDSVVGTDSHTPMVNGLGVVGWGVGGLEAEAVMLDQPISMVLPKVLGFRLIGKVPQHVTSTDLVLSITRVLREKDVVGQFVEFHGPGVNELSVADRATISNMAPEMGATICIFPFDEQTLNYMKLTGRAPAHINEAEEYMKAVGMFSDYREGESAAVYSDLVVFDLSKLVPSIAGPKCPHDHIPLSSSKQDFLNCLNNDKVEFKGFGVPADKRAVRAPLQYKGKSYTLQHGSIVIAAITSCTNTSNPDVIIGAGLLAKKAVEAGLAVLPYIKTSFAPGSRVVSHYLQRSGLLPYLEKLGFYLVGYGCTTCIGNSGPLPQEVADVVDQYDLVASAVLSGNRNFEGRIHSHVRANYLASPPLVIAYAIAGTMNFDMSIDPLGHDASGKPIYLKDIWPLKHEIAQVVQKNVLAEQFREIYSRVTQGTPAWASLRASSETLYPWDDTSTYIHKPPYFTNMKREISPVFKVADARVLLHLGDLVTTDHISPAGGIHKDSPAAKYLESRGVKRQDFNTYGSRRGNDEVMVRGTFANIRLFNKFIGKPGPLTVHHESGRTGSVYDIAQLYKAENVPLIILGGKQYGSGSSRDWAAKGVKLLGIQCIISESYERIHRSNLIQFGIVPLQFKEGENSSTLGLTGKEKFSFDLGSASKIKPSQDVVVHVSGGKVSQFVTTLRFDTESEVVYYLHGGVLNFVIRETIASV